MRKWLVRFVSLYVFNIAVLLLVGMLLPRVRVGWSALWAAVILTAAVLWLKPLVASIFSGIADRGSGTRSSGIERLVRWGLVLAVELVIWIVVVWLSDIHVASWFWGWLLPPVALLIAWAIYDAVDDRIEARADDLYGKAQSRIQKN